VLAIHKHIFNHNPIDTLSGLEWLQNYTLCRLSHSPQPVSVGRKKVMRTKTLQHITTNPDISYEFDFDFDFTTSFRLFGAMLAQKPSTSWHMSASEDSVGGVYPIFVSLVTHVMTTHFCATICWGAFIPIFEICTTPLRFRAAIEKAIWHWINGPLSIWKVSTCTA
jgi:hypothetical protein